MKAIYIMALLLAAIPGHAKDLGIAGTTYPIVEQDMLAEMLEKARHVDWEKAIDKERAAKAIKKFKPRGIRNLPRAADDRTFQVDMTYTLEADITDREGSVLYPKGYTFNPLDYVHNPGTIFVVLNGADRPQVNWFKHSRYMNSTNVTLMLTDGSYYDLGQELKRPVFYAVHGVIERFELQHVPSVIQQKGRVMEVQEIAVDHAKNHS
jgi:conjugal transfer pilus assembly protein TraW